MITSLKTIHIKTIDSMHTCKQNENYKRRANHFYCSFHVKTLKSADVMDGINASVVMNNGEEITPEAVAETPEVLKVIPEVTSEVTAEVVEEVEMEITEMVAEVVASTSGETVRSLNTIN